MATAQADPAVQTPQPAAKRVDKTTLPTLAFLPESLSTVDFRSTLDMRAGDSRQSTAPVPGLVPASQLSSDGASLQQVTPKVVMPKPVTLPVESPTAQRNPIKPPQQFAETPADKPTDKLGGKVAEKAADKVAERSTEKAVGKVSKKWVEWAEEPAAPRSAITFKTVDALPPLEPASPGRELAREPVREPSRELANKEPMSREQIFKELMAKESPSAEPAGKQQLAKEVQPKDPFAKEPSAKDAYAKDQLAKELAREAGAEPIREAASKPAVKVVTRDPAERLDLPSAPVKVAQQPPQRRPMVLGASGSITAPPSVQAPAAAQAAPAIAAAAAASNAGVPGKGVTHVPVAQPSAIGPSNAVAPAGALDCLIQAKEIVQVGSPVAGVLDKVEVERGDIVRRGQVLARLQADVERAAFELARTRAEQQAEVVAAYRSQEFAQREFDRASNLADKNFVSGNYLDKAQTELQLARSRLKQAQEKRIAADREVELARAQMDLRMIRSPIEGVVVERHHASGEYVDDKPIVKLAAIDILRVDVIVPSQAFGQVQRGGVATVYPELKGASPKQASVVLVDRIIDPASNTFRVRLELPNPQFALPAGLRCKVDLGLPAMDSGRPGGLRQGPK